MTDEEERDFCTREWSRVNKDKTVAVVDWLMSLRSGFRIEAALLRVENDRLKRSLERQTRETVHVWSLCHQNAVVADTLQSKLAAVQAELEEAKHFATYQAHAETRQELTAAQAEIAALTRDLAEVHEWRRECQNKLTAAQAELSAKVDYIDHKEHELKAIYILHSNCVDARDAALTKLTNLRTAAERLLYRKGESVEADQRALLAAIEASR